MKINTNKLVVLNELFLYDIEKCNYSILSKIAPEKVDFPYDDKLKVNIRIGNLFRDFPFLSSFVRSITNSTLNNYIRQNKVKEEDIVLRQYDGLLLKRRLQKTEIGEIKLPLRKVYKVFITDFDKKQYIAKTSENKIIAKGITNFNLKENPYIYQYYERLLSLNFYADFFSNLESIKKDFFSELEQNEELFCIKKKNSDMAQILSKSIGSFYISKNSSNFVFVDTSDLDKKKYYEIFIRDFIDSILYEFL